MLITTDTYHLCTTSLERQFSNPCFSAHPLPPDISTITRLHKISGTKFRRVSSLARRRGKKVVTHSTWHRTRDRKIKKLETNDHKTPSPLWQLAVTCRSETSCHLRALAFLSSPRNLWQLPSTSPNLRQRYRSASQSKFRFLLQDLDHTQKPFQTQAVANHPNLPIVEFRHYHLQCLPLAHPLLLQAGP